MEVEQTKYRPTRYPSFRSEIFDIDTAERAKKVKRTIYETFEFGFFSVKIS